MYRQVIALLLVLYSGYASAHSWTPTYPVFSPSYIDGVIQTEMLLFNRRQDVKYFEVEVTDKDFNPIPFASDSKIYRAEYLQRVKVMIFIREDSLFNATYICSRSKFLESAVPTNLVSSRVCSKIR